MIESIFLEMKLILKAYDKRVAAARKTRDRDLAAMFVCREYDETGQNKRSEWLDAPGSEQIRSSQAGGFRFGPDD